MFASFPLPKRTLPLLLLGGVAFWGGNAFADDLRTRHVVTDDQVALQPFAPDAPVVARPVHRNMEVAYYAPRPIPRAERPIASDDLDGEEGFSRGGSDFRGGSQPMVNGNRAALRNGVAYAPSNAPDRVKSAIWAVNTIRTKPYIWGGGHGSFTDRGYDCSGTVSFALHHAGLLGTPLPSKDFMRYGERGRGRWITVYSKNGHTFAMIAGLRLDTTDFRIGGDVGPRWHMDYRDTRGFVATHPAGL